MQLDITASITKVAVDCCQWAFLPNVVLKVLASNLSDFAAIWAGHWVVVASGPVVG